MIQWCAYIHFILFYFFFVLSFLFILFHSRIFCCCCCCCCSCGLLLCALLMKLDFQTKSCSDLVGHHHTAYMATILYFSSFFFVRLTNGCFFSSQCDLRTANRQIIRSHYKTFELMQAKQNVFFFSTPCVCVFVFNYYLVKMWNIFISRSCVQTSAISLFVHSPNLQRCLSVKIILLPFTVWWALGFQAILHSDTHTCLHEIYNFGYSTYDWLHFESVHWAREKIIFEGIRKKKIQVSMREIFHNLSRTRQTFASHTLVYSTSCRGFPQAPQKYRHNNVHNQNSTRQKSLHVLLIP